MGVRTISGFIDISFIFDDSLLPDKDTAFWAKRRQREGVSLARLNKMDILANICYKSGDFRKEICRSGIYAYLCNVFFIVLDLRLTKVGLSGALFLCPYPSCLRRHSLPFLHTTGHKKRMRLATHPLLKEVGLPRFELGQTEPKSVVLPLHHSPNTELSVKKRGFPQSEYPGFWLNAGEYINAS